MAIVTQTDKRTGITYAYETQYYWDKEKQQSRAKRVCVGKVDPATKEIIPTRGRSRKKEEPTDYPVSKRGPNPFVRQNTSTMAQHICLISWPMNLDLQLI
mgnify:CR=1 FL=1